MEAIDDFGKNHFTGETGLNSKGRVDEKSRRQEGGWEEQTLAVEGEKGVVARGIQEAVKYD